MAHMRGATLWGRAASKNDRENSPLDIPLPLSGRDVAQAVVGKDYNSIGFGKSC